CTHCCFSAGKQGEEMTTQKVTEILHKIIKWQPDKITITGGEPLLRNDLLEHLKFLREAFGGTVILATNGTLIHEENVSDIIQYIDRIDISIDGADEGSCRKIRGKGVFGKVLKSVALLKRQGFNSISLSMVLTEDNEKLADQFLDLNRKLGTFPVLRRISWIGRALENQKELTSNEVLYEHGAEIRKDEKNMCTYANCQNLVSKYHIRYDGYVYACQTIEDRKYSLGHIDQ
ncbi:radical SAM protein, partial [Mediterraneibacter glycyrrhizinilyticus]